MPLNFRYIFLILEMEVFGVKKIIFGLFMALTLIICTNCDAADKNVEQPAKADKILKNPAGNPVAQFTGEYWLQSTPENKEAYLFGIDSAVAVEKYISEKSQVGKKGKKQIVTLSPFETGWMKAFENMTRKEIVEEVDAWYKANPDKQNRPVLEVIWYEVIAPRLEENK